MQSGMQQPVKAFDLLPVLEYTAPAGHPTCISVAGNDIYVGYNTGHVRHFLVSSSTNSSTGRTKYSVRFLDDMIGASRKTVSHLVIAPTIARVVGLAEGSLFVGDMFSMVLAQSYSRSTPKSVSCISVNEGSTSYEMEIAVCVAKKKSVLLMMVTTERFVVKQEISNLAGVPVAVTWHGSIILLAYESCYSLFNLMSRTEMELFPYDSSVTRPLIQPLGSEGELYLSEGGLGMIIGQSGDVSRAPIVWSENPSFVGYSNPYLVGVSDTSIQVYSLIDQQLKQQSGFAGVRCVAGFAGNVFLVTLHQLYMMLPVPADEQVERLLDSGHVTQAMALADETLANLTRTPAKISRLKILRQKAAKMHWEVGELTEAFELYTRTETPPEQIYSLYDTLSAGTTTSRSTKVSVAGKTEEEQREYHTALLQFIVRSGAPKMEELNTVEFKLAALVSRGVQGRVEQLLREGKPLNVTEIITFLQHNHLYHMLAEFYAAHSFVAEAVEQWRALEEGLVVDAAYPGLSRLVQLLLDTNIQGVIMTHVEWLLSRDQHATLRLLTSTTAELNHDQVLTLLKDTPDSLLFYLEDLVVTKKTEVCRFHTQLAQQYLHAYHHADDERIKQRIRKKLQEHLLTSDKYAVSHILAKLEGTRDLKRELAILYGKLQEHEKALRVLVEVDLAGAEEYCRVWPTDRATLHLLLLRIYLGSGEDSLAERAVTLLNSPTSTFNYSEVYAVIPGDWPIALIEPFIYRSLSSECHRYRSGRIRKGLTELEWCRVGAERAAITSRTVRVTTATYCSYCFKAFTDPNCGVSVAGEVFHTTCLSNVT